MAAVLAAEVLQDELALSLARVLAVANEKAREAGVNLLDCLISITQRSSTDGPQAGLIWRVNYGPKEPVGRRGGDFVVDVDASDGTIRQVLRGQ